MIALSDLRGALLELLREVQDSEVRLIIGGGFGIFLKSEQVRKLEQRTLLSEWPEPHSTNDLDLFLRPELLIHSEKLKPLAAAVTKLAYTPVPGAEKHQFIRPVAGMETAVVKLDLLTGPERCFAGTKAKVDGRRVRPRPSVDLHAHPVNEAPTLEEGLTPVTLAGRLPSGDDWRGEVYLPHPFTYLMMKLFAFRDRRDDPDKDFGRYHALDLYTILATATETEWKEAVRLRARFGEEPTVIEAGRVVAHHFSMEDRMGILRLKESPYFRPELQVRDFMSALAELFPLKRGGRG